LSAIVVVLKGQKPADFPVQLRSNLKTANTQLLPPKSNIAGPIAGLFARKGGAATE
jgi:hypothetical protein